MNNRLHNEVCCTICDTLSTYCPHIITLVKVEKLIKKSVVQKFCRHRAMLGGITQSSEWTHIFDCVISAKKEYAPAIEYLKFLDQQTYKLYELVSKVCPDQEKEIIHKIKNVFRSYDFSKQNCTSLNHANEIFVSYKLIFESANNGYEFDCFEHTLPNGKRLDLSFKKSGRIVGIEIKSLHHIFDREYDTEKLIQRISRKVNSKALSKGLRQKENKYIYPELNDEFLICIVMTDEFDILKSNKEIIQTTNDLMSGRMLPCCSVCILEMPDGSFETLFGDILTMIQEHGEAE